jgi:hypothetical protein
VIIKVAEANSGTFRIYSILGESLKEGNLSGSRTQVNISDMPHGVYLINVATEEGNATQKLVVAE